MRKRYGRGRERRMRKAFYWLLLPAAVLLAALLIQFSPAGEEDWKDLVDSFAGIAVRKEQGNLRFEQAIALGRDYLAGRAGTQETDAALEEVYTETMAEYAGTERIEILPEQEKAMEKYGIAPADYAAMADEHITDLYSDGQSLYTLRTCVREEDRETLSDLLDLQEAIRTLKCEYDAWAVNYLFCGWEGEKLAYVNECVVDRLAPEHRPKEWLTDREEIEERITVCLDQWEEYCWELAQDVERMELELGRTQQQLEPDAGS